MRFLPLYNRAKHSRDARYAPNVITVSHPASIARMQLVVAVRRADAILKSTR